MEPKQGIIRRSRARELAMQILFLWDSHGQQDLEMAQHILADAKTEGRIERTALAMASAAWEQRETTDRWIERIAPQWPIARQTPVDRNILRLSVWETTNSRTPVLVIIDEAIKLAETYSSTQSVAFINGVLDAIVKEHQALTSAQPQQPEQSQPPAEPQAEDSL
jgi:transcription antitermination protein NusB